MPTVFSLYPPLIVLDVAVIEESLVNKINVIDPIKQHIINLDIIDISQDDFKALFYFNDIADPSFSVYPAAKEHGLFGKITFSAPDRKINDEPFCLHDELLAQYCKDAGVTIDQFTPSSLITLNKQIMSITSLSSVYKNNSGSELNCSMSWKTVIQSIKSQMLCKLAVMPTDIEVILMITCVFIQTPGISGGITFLPVVVKFPYRVTVDLV
jgi:hypothetical protein